ncbi:hypothetical protein H8E50_10750 [bacterium]|nr:hypothetical protein [bacterium]
MQSIKKLLVVMMVSFFVMANMAVPAGAVVTDFANKVSIPQNTIVIIIDESGTEVYKGACEEKKEEGQEDDQCSALLLDLPKGTYTVKTLDGSVIGKVTVSTMSPLTVIGGVLLTGTAIGIAVDNDSSRRLSR